MGNRRFSVTTYILVGISLIALYFVGKTVNPPPAPPPREIDPVKTSAAENSKIAMQRQQEEENRAKERATQIKMMATKSPPRASNSKTPVFNPTGIDTGNEYWHDPSVDMGKKGEAQMQEKVKKALEAQKDAPKGPSKAPVPAMPSP